MIKALYDFNNKNKHNYITTIRITMEKNTRINITTQMLDEMERVLYNLNMSVRKIKKSYISCTGYFASYKNKSQVAFESVLERNYFMMLEFDSNVVKYEEQPLSIEYKYSDGTKRKYTPDVLVTFKNRQQELIEVKYQEEIDNSVELQNKIALLKKEFNYEHNIRFSVFTNNDICQTTLENYNFLYKFVFIPEDKEKTEHINNILNESYDLTIKDLLNEISPKKSIQMIYLPYIWNYIFHNLKVVRVYEKLTMNSFIQKGV